MQTLVLAHDGRDPEAPERRRRVRERHPKGVRPAVGSGVVPRAGTVLEHTRGPRGKVLPVRAQSERAVQDRLERDVHHRESVWQRVDVRPFERCV